MSKNNEDENYINEIIRVNYKCNWACKFCNVLKTNNYGDKDVSSKEVISKILNLTKKYSAKEINNLLLSFSGGEPTLNKNLISFIKLAKQIGVGTVQIQTNGIILFKEKEFIKELVDTGLDEVFLAQHGYDEIVNKKMGTYILQDNFKSWIKYIKENDILTNIKFHFNIVVNKINLFHILDYINYLKENNFLDLLPIENNYGFKNTKKISFGLVQPNGYANINKNKVLLKYDKYEKNEIEKIVDFCKNNNIYPDFHFTAPPLCVLDYPEYNLEYKRLHSIKEDIINDEVCEGNLESYMVLSKEKIKFDYCKKCNYNEYCLGFYKNWVSYMGEDYIKEKVVKKFIFK